MMNLQPPRQPFTGEGFKGERVLAVIGITLSIISTLLLIDLTTRQRRHLKMESDKFKKDNGIE